MGSRGWVELRNSKPLRVTSADRKPLDFTQVRGPLIIRAAPGAERIVEFELSGSKPLLATGSGVSLLLSGVSIVVHYSGSASSPSAIPPALITLAGKSKLDRCAFKVASPSQPKSRAVFSSMGALEVERCWFEGFDEAIEVEAGYKTEMRMSQTMIVPAPGHGLIPPQPGEWYGWGVKFTFNADIRTPTNGVQSKPNLTLEHCTVEGAGLFDLTTSPGPAPIQLVVNHCAFRANTLLALNSNRSGQHQFNWVGAGNQYDILGRSWIVHSTQGSPALSTDVTDLDSWLKFTDIEKEPIRSKLKYQIDPARRPASLRPHEFTIEAPAPPLSRPGADPVLVGPWSNP